MIVISHTGETAFARRARARALAAGARLVTITAEGSTWPEAVPTVPRERSDTYTGSYLAALVVLARLSLALGQSTLDERRLATLPDAVRAAADQPVQMDLDGRRAVVLAGVGPGAITAREGALKPREAARVLAEGYEAEYLLHGSVDRAPPGPGRARGAAARHRPGHGDHRRVGRRGSVASRRPGRRRVRVISGPRGGRPAAGSA